MPTYDVELRDTAEYRADRLEAEIRRLERRLTWAMRAKEVKKAERLAHQLAHLERELATPAEARGHELQRRREWGPLAGAFGA